ncbi:MAG: peptidase M50 [Pseudomonadota bacterium]
MISDGTPLPVPGRSALSAGDATTTLTAAWHAAAGLRPRLREHVEIHRHRYRGERWYVLQDHASGKFSRFTAPAYYLIALMDGERTLAEIWEEAREAFGEEAPTQEQLMSLLTQLHGSDVLLTDEVPDAGELARRSARLLRQQRVARFRTPLAIRVPLIDPEWLLTQMAGVARWLFSWPGLCLWLAVVSSAALQVGVHWDALTGNLADRVLSPDNLIMLLFVFPLVKVLHEIGHGLAVKRWGGEVHEMGVMLLVFVPVPYVDASASSALRSRGQRMVVGAAGMIVEVFIAAVAFHLWVQAEEGVVRAIAFNVMFIAGVSTVLFNGNPLLRFDGYYILMDALEIPNLGSRANRQIGYLVRRHFLRQEGLRPVTRDAGEGVWLATYGVLAFAYRLFVMTMIVLFIAGQYFVFGVVLALWVLANAVVLPMLKHTSTLLFDPSLIGQRGAAIGRTGVAILIVCAAVIAVPLPEHTTAQGVVLPPDEAVLYATGGGVVDEVLAEVASTVEEGDVLLRLSDPVLEAQVRAYEAEVREARARLLAARASDRVLAASVTERLELARSRLEDARTRLAGLTIRAHRGGRFLLAQAPLDIPGSYVQRGDALGWILARPPQRVRAAVPMERADRVSNDSRSVEVLITSKRATPQAGKLIREVPAATFQLPAAALGREGGGPFALDPTAQQPGTTVQPLFEIDVELSEALAYERLGQRAYLKFRHSWSPLIQRWSRQLRQLFLRRFDL